VGGLVTGALKAVFFDKGFQQHRTIAIHGLLLLGQYFSA
jgi:hypothetical protein